MRTLSPALLAAQATPDPYAAVTARFKRRATFAGDPLAWRLLFRHTAENMPYGDLGVTAAVCPCFQAGSAVRVLRSQSALKVGVQRFSTLTWQGSGSSWSAAAEAALTAAPVQVGTLTTAISGESTVCLGRLSSFLRGLYADGGKLYLLSSNNDGVTWLASSLVWNGSATYNRLSNFVATNNSTRIFFAFNTYTAAGVSGVRCVSNALLTPWPELPDAAGVGWQVAGLVYGSTFEPEPCLYVYLTGVLGGYSVLACQRVKLNADFTFNSWDGSPKVVDRAGWSDSVHYERVRLGPAGGSYLFALQEWAVNGYWFVSSLFSLPGSLDIEEPVYLAAAGAAGGNVATAEYLQPLQLGLRAWLLGAGEVWASAQSEELSNLAVRSYTPVRYTHRVGYNGGGEITLWFDRPQSGEAAPETFGGVPNPEIYVGDILWLDRALAGQVMTLVFRVVQVVYSRAGVEVLAADALGMMGHMRPRRAKRLAVDERLRMADVDALVHWCGLDVTGSTSLPHAVYPSRGFTWPANDSGLGALRRYLLDEVIALRSAGGASGGQTHTTVELMALPTASSYVYVSPHGLDEGMGGHEIADWGLAMDGRPARLMAAVGLATAGDPLGNQGVKGWSLALARPLPGVRPFPLSMTDYGRGVDDGSVGALGEGQAQWLLFGLPLGWIESGANLGIELYDVVTVDETLGRVVQLTETWERGRLRQRLELAEVNSFGVSVG